jgi:hypothetical protein
MAGHRISLVSGEYFFQNYGQQEQRACVAAGQLALQAAGSDSAETIKAPSCTRIVTGAAPETTARNPDDWIAVRRAYSIEATAMAMLEPANSVAAPAAPTPPRRVINTAAMPSFSTAEPVAIPAANEPAAPALSALPDYRNEPPAIHTPGPGPVVAAPVLPPPLAPRTGMVASTVLVEEPLLAISPPLAAPTARAAPIIASPVTPPVPPLPSVGPSRQMPTATAPASAATAAGSWALNIASYPESAVAVQQTQKLQNAGYTGVMSPAMVNGRTWYRVQIVGFANEPAARGAANELRDKLGLKGIWVMRLP